MKYITLLFCLLSCFLLSACSTLKAGATKEYGFAPQPELLTENRDRAPFHGYWNRDGEGFYQLIKEAGTVKIAPVDIRFVEQAYQNAQGSEDVKLDRIEEARQLAEYFRQKILLIIEQAPELSALKSDENTSGSDHFPTLHLAFVELIPTNPGVNFVGTVAGTFVPGGGLIKYFGKGSVAIESFSDHRSRGQGTVLWEQFKDREGQKTSAFTLKDYQRYAHIREIIDEWSMQIVQLLTTPPDHTVEDSAVLSINPL